MCFTVGGAQASCQCNVATLGMKYCGLHIPAIRQYARNVWLSLSINTACSVGTSGCVLSCDVLVLDSSCPGARLAESYLLCSSVFVHCIQCSYFASYPHLDVAGKQLMLKMHPVASSRLCLHEKNSLGACTVTLDASPSADVHGLTVDITRDIATFEGFFLC